MDSHSGLTDRPKAHARVRRLQKDLRAIVWDGATFSVMIGIGETYLPAFALAIGKSELVAGLIATVPMLVGGLLQLVSPAAVAKLRSHRRWVVLCAVLQAASFVPLIAAGVCGSLPTGVLFLVAAMYWGTNLGAGAAWNAWVETLVPRPIRAHYFARRTRIAQAGVLAGLLAGGAALQLGRNLWATGHVFAGMFAVACLCRVVSARMLARQSEPKPLSEAEQYESAAGSVRRAFGWKSPPAVRRLLAYLLLMQAAVQIAGPYFTAFMLHHLRFAYGEYVVLVASAFVARILVLPLLGTFAKRFGAKRLLWLGAIGIVPLPALWLISTAFWFLCVVQVVGGIVWAAHELAMLLLFFDSIPRSARTRVLALFNFANATSMVAGTVIGAVLLAWLGEQAQTYLILFAASGTARLLPLALLARIPRRVAVTVPLALRVLAVRPSADSVDRPILSSTIPDAEENESSH